MLSPVPSFGLNTPEPSFGLNTPESTSHAGYSPSPLARGMRGQSFSTGQYIPGYSQQHSKKLSGNKMISEHGENIPPELQGVSVKDLVKALGNHL